jgi:hypothetical protein
VAEHAFSRFDCCGPVVLESSDNRADEHLHRQRCSSRSGLQKIRRGIKKGSNS